MSERKDWRKEMEALSPPDLIIGDVPKFADPVTLASGNAIRGMGVAVGKASGPARLIYHCANWVTRCLRQLLGRR